MLLEKNIGLVWKNMTTYIVRRKQCYTQGKRIGGGEGPETLSTGMIFIYSFIHSGMIAAIRSPCHGREIRRVEGVDPILFHKIRSYPIQASSSTQITMGPR